MFTSVAGDCEIPRFVCAFFDPPPACAEAIQKMAAGMRVSVQ